MTAEILIVDDDASVRRSLVRILSARGYRTTAVASGAAAVRRAAQLRPDLILMDLHMPDMAGIDAARALKADPALANVPVIAMSATPPQVELDPLFTSFLLKPTPSAELFSAIEHALRRPP